MLSRRVWLTCLALSLMGGCGRRQTAKDGREQGEAADQPQGAESAKSLEILMLGGTGFLGPHVVRRALDAGHRVTLFNRGQTNPHLFPELEKLRGDRNTDLRALEGRRFDAVIDTSGYLPRQVRASAELLADSGQYLFVSSVSVYAEQGKAGLRTSDAVARHPDPGSEDVQRYYGPLKALCEQAARAAMPDKVTVVRPGLIVGPGDPSDRFSYWPVRLDRGGEVLAPGRPSDPVQFIDARDLADFMVTLLERRRVSTYNAVGPRDRTSLEMLLREGIRALAASVELTWVSAEFLAAQGVAPWTQLPVWVPPEHPEVGGLGQVRGDEAFADGLEPRPVAETMRDTLAWWKQLPQTRRDEPRAGLAPAREAELLAAWRGRDGARDGSGNGSRAGAGAD